MCGRTPAAAAALSSPDISMAASLPGSSLGIRTNWPRLRGRVWASCLRDSYRIFFWKLRLLRLTLREAAAERSQAADPALVLCIEQRGAMGERAQPGINPVCKHHTDIGNKTAYTQVPDTVGMRFLNGDALKAQKGNAGKGAPRMPRMERERSSGQGQGGRGRESRGGQPLRETRSPRKATWSKSRQGPRASASPVLVQRRQPALLPRGLDDHAHLGSGAVPTGRVTGPVPAGQVVAELGQRLPANRKRDGGGRRAAGGCLVQQVKQGPALPVDAEVARVGVVKAAAHPSLVA